MPETLAQLRATLARAEYKSRTTGDQTPVIASRRAYAAAKLEDCVKRIVDAAPPLTDDERARIAALLRGGGPNAAA